MTAISTSRAFAVALSIALVLPARGSFTSDARKVFADRAPSVLGVRGVLKISVSQNGRQANAQERPVWSNAVCVGDRMFVAAYRSLYLNVSPRGGKQSGVELESELSELKLIDEKGEEYDAKLVLHDEDLGLAFIVQTPSAESVEVLSVKAVELPEEVAVAHLDQLISIGRMAERWRYQPKVWTSEVTAIVERPRKVIHMNRISTSTPVFTRKGELAGLTVVMKSRPGGSPTSVVLPSKYIRSFVEQASQRMETLADEPQE